MKKTFGELKVGDKIGEEQAVQKEPIKTREITWIENISEHTKKIYYTGGNILVDSEEEQCFIHQRGNFYADYNWFKENILKKEIERLNSL